MRIVQTGDLTPDTMPKSETEKLHIYNGLDCCITFEVFEVIEPQLDEVTRKTYDFSLALQAPVLEMKLRGVLVDQNKRAEVIEHYLKLSAQLQKNLNRLLVDGIGFACNWNSPIQLQRLFYDVMGLPPIKSKGKITTNRDALEKLQKHFLAIPICRHILALRELGKKIGVLKTGIDRDGRMRTSYNIAGTTTGRLSSSLSDFGTGTNLQNIEELLREVFIADPGQKMGYVDKEQAESRLVGALCWNLFGESAYLDACESGDLHTVVCRMAWKDLPWTGDLARDKIIAEQPFYRMYSYRYMAKRLGHGTNYRGKPFTMAQQTKVDRPVIEEFQFRYFQAFPEIKKWHEWVEQQINDNGVLTTLTGRRRWFFGRRDDDKTIRGAIAYDPQGSIGDVLNHGMIQIWRADQVKLLLQIHDALVFQFPEAQEAEIMARVLELIPYSIELKNGRVLHIPSDVKSGWNWRPYDDEKPGLNPDGLKKYKGRDDRQRQRKPTTSILDRRFL